MRKHTGKIRITAVLAALVLCFGAALPCLATGISGATEENPSVELTAAEQQYIQENPRVSIAIDTSWVPYEFLENDEAHGIIPELMTLVAERVGLQVDFVTKDSYIDAITACNTGETMLVSGIANDSRMAEKNNVNITDPYINIGYTAVTKRETENLYVPGANCRAAICVGTYAKIAMQDRMPNYTFVEYHSNEECMDAVRRGEAEIALVANYSVGYYSNWHEYSRLQCIQINDFNWGLCFGVNKQCDPMLIEVLNKGIASLDENTVNQAIYSGTVDASGSTNRLSDAIYGQPGIVAAATAILVILIASAVAVYLFQRRKIAELKREKKLLDDIQRKDLLLNAIPTGIGVFEISEGTAHLRYLNDSFYRMVGDTRETRRRREQEDFMQGVWAQDRPVVQAHIRKIIGGASQTEYDYRAIKPDGSTVWLHLVALVTQREADKITVYCGLNCVEEEVRTRHELQDSLATLDAAAESARMNVWRIDCKNHTMTLERSATHSNFVSRVENVPESLIADGYVHPDSAAAYREAFTRLVAEQKPVQGDFLVHSMDGDGYWWEHMILTPVMEDGEMTHAIGTSFNITDRKEKERHYLQLVENMDDAAEKNLIAKGRHNLTRNTILYYARVTPDGMALAENGFYDDALAGLEKTAINARQAQAIRACLNRRRLLQDYAAGVRENRFEYVRRLEDGSSIWARLKYSMTEEPNSADVVLFIYAYDESDRILENHMIARLGSTEYDVLGVIDLATGYYKSRNVYGAVSGAAPAEVTEGDFDTLAQEGIQRYVPKAEQEDMLRQLNVENAVRQLETQDFYFIACSVQGCGGEYRRKKLQFSYLDDTHTAIFYYRSDITEMYEREQKQLRCTEEALEAARRASEAKTEFFSRMSHDMRTPMNGILGLANLSEDEGDMTVLKENIRKIQSSGKYLLGLINDTLDFQKIESGRMQIEPQIVFARELLDSAVGMVQTTAEQKGVIFRTQVENACLDCYVKVDPMRLRQIFLNLLSNAIKFTPAGGTVEGRYLCTGHTGTIAHAVITVSDSGVGMSSAFLQNGIFQPFAQEQNVFSTGYAGTGLGLSIAKKLVEMMGGTISVESELGVGTTFTVRLDIECVKDADAVESASDVRTRRTRVTTELQGRHILLAEDHPLNAEIAVKLLEKVGCRVTWVKDGRECVDTFQKAAAHTFDAILMDIRMPNMDGLEATRTIRALPRGDAAAVPIIAMTANAYDEDARQSRLAGMNGHLAKPFEPLVMYETLAEWIEK